MHRSRSLLAASILAGLLPAAAWAAPDYVGDGLRAMSAGDLRAAQIQFRNAVKANPKDAAANYQLGVVSLLLGDAAAAEKDGLSAQNLGYDATAATRLTMKAYLAEGRFRDLLRDFPPAAGKPELQAAVLLARGQAQVGLDQVDQAQASFAEARRLDPNAVEPLLEEAQLAINRKDLATANQRVDEALHIAPNSAEALQRRAVLLAQSGDQKGALAASDKVVAAAPGQYGYRLSRAGLLLAYNQDAAAKIDIDAVLASVPNNAQATYDRAVLLTRAQDYKGADVELQKLSEYISRVPSGYLLLALVKQKLGQSEQAMDAATRYAARNPADLRGSLLLADLDVQAKQYDRAIEILTAAIGGGGKDPGLYDLRGRALGSVGRFAEAAEDYQKGVALSPDNPLLLARLGATELTLGNAEAARVALSRSVQLAPGQVATMQLAAEADLASGRLDDAKVAIAQLRTTQADPEAIANMDGLLKLATFDLPGAQATFEGILRDHPDATAAQLNLARVDRLEGRIDDSSDLLRKVLQHDPTQDRAVDELTATLVQQHQVADAIAVLQKAHETAPSNAKFLAKLAELYFASNDPAKALALTDTPAPDQAAGLGQAAVRGNPASALPQLLVRAQAQLLLKQFDDAAATYRKVLAINPEVTFARLQLIRILMTANDAAGAAAVLQEGLASQPQNGALLQASVAIDEKRGGFDAALAGADRLAKQTNVALPLKGDLYMQAKRYDDAVKAYEAAMKTTASTVLALKISSALTAAGHADQAAQRLRAWLVQHPDDNEAAMALADMAIGGLRLPEAKTLLTGVVARQPANVAALNNLAWVEQQGKGPQALALAERAYMLAPGPQTADTLGYILATQGGGDSGVALLRQAGAQMPADLGVQYHLAVALKAAGQPAEAVKVLTPVVATQGNFREKPQARQLLAELSPQR